MKKFLVILMVVAMASFLFVGCLPGVTPGVDDDEEDEDVGVKTDTPYITDAGAVSILATATQYINAVTGSGKELTDFKVDGVGVAGAIIKLYINDVYAGVGSTGAGGKFDDVIVSAITVTEGANKFYVTATVPGLAESDKSTEYPFTYDKTKPTIASVVGDSSSSYITVTFSEAVKATTVVAAAWTYGSNALTYNAPAETPSAIATPTTTTAILYEATTPLADALATDDCLSVTCATTAVADLAGNLMVIPVTIRGFVVL